MSGGSWNIDRAVKARWDEKLLDAKFKAYWPSPAESRWQAFNDGESRPGARMPYCIYEKGVAVKTGESTGTPGEGGFKIEYWTQPVQFRIHAANVSGPPKLSAKEVAKRLAESIVEAFEDDAGVLDIGDGDCHVETVIGQDFHTREDDDVVAWVVQIEINHERRRAIRGVA